MHSSSTRLGWDLPPKLKLNGDGQLIIKTALAVPEVTSYGERNLQDLLTRTKGFFKNLSSDEIEQKAQIINQ